MYVKNKDNGMFSFSWGIKVKGQTVILLLHVQTEARPSMIKKSFRKHTHLDAGTIQEAAEELYPQSNQMSWRLIYAAC